MTNSKPKTQNPKPIGLPKGPYNAQETEPKILEYWLENKFFKPEYHPEKGLLSMEEMKNDGRETFSIVNPPPNAYMRPHIGNVSGYAYQDVFLRYNRMLGKKVLGQPGKDHAGIQGEVVLEKIFRENKGKEKHEMGREKFYMASYSHFLKLMPKVMDDEKRIGLSSDYDRNLFTLDPRIVKTVLGTFTKMFDDEMVYKGVRIVNWDPVAKTTLADIDTEREERDGELVYINYQIATNSEHTTQNSSLKTIVFDLHNVIFKTSSEKYKNVAKILKVNEKEAREIINKEYSEWEKEDNQIEQKFWNRIVKAFDINEEQLQQFKDEWYFAITPNTELIEYTSELKKSGLKIGFLTNSFKDWIVNIDKDLHFLDLVDYDFYSINEGVYKPDTTSYQKFVEKFGLNPEETLFIDDKFENLTPAKELGWQTFHYADNVANLKAFIETGAEFVTVATTRAETMLGDTAVVVNPKDERYKHLVGQKLILPIVNREIPIITSPHVDMEFGTGAVKLTPAHSMDDYKMMTEWERSAAGRSTGVGYINIIDKSGKMTGPIPEKYIGMTTEECRKAVIEDLDEMGLVIKREPHKMNVMIGERSKAVVEQIMSSQWFIDVERLKQPAIDAVKNDDVKIYPDYMKKKYLHWMENLRDWPVSRSLWWGYRIPVWYKGEVKEEINQETGQIVETIGGIEVKGIYDAVEKGLARVQLYDPAVEESYSPILVPGRGAPELRTLYKDIKGQYPYAQLVDTGEINQTYHDYKMALDQVYFDENSVIVAHSLGAAAVMQYMVENDLKAKALILLAPTNKYSPNYEKDITKGFWKDYESIKSIKTRVKDLKMIYSDNDEFFSKEQFEELADELGTEKILEPGKKHFLRKDYRHDSEELTKQLQVYSEQLTAEEPSDLQPGHLATSITILRHGETTDNREKRFIGRNQTPLNENGQKQAREFAEKINPGDYDLIISSPLERAKETAEIINEKLNLPIEYDERIQERDFGVITGKTWQEVEEEMPNLAKEINESYQVELPEGETLETVNARIDEFIEDIKQKYAGKRILVLTHTGAIRIFRRRLGGESVERTREVRTPNLGTHDYVLTDQTVELSAWTQDPDVFDTWFSSGQWAYATLTANDLMDTFYPSDIMETAYDILELWVSRMIMLSLYTQGTIPFKNVYLHGLVKAPDGQKMSKSKGNVIQPEEIINEYGADALRLMYVVGNKAGSGYPISYDKLEGYKRFLNKIWNASRFVLGNVQDLDSLKSLVSSLPTSSNEQDKQIIKGIQGLKVTTTRHMEAYRIGMAAEEIYNHFWHTFCDVHLEEVKTRLYTKDKEGNPINQSDEAKADRKAAQETLIWGLGEYLKMMHPFVPFITERLWQELSESTIMYERWG